MEQASEALRSELSDWTPKTRADLKHLLLDLAERKVAAHSQILMGWEHALRLCSETDVSQLFKTVSKTAVLNLSPSKCHPDGTPTETERDLDELEADSNDSVSRDCVTDFDNAISEISLDASVKRSENVSDDVKQNHIYNGSENAKHDLADSIVKDILNETKGDVNDEFIHNILKDDNGRKSEQYAAVEETSAKSNVTEGEEKVREDVTSDPLRDFSEVDLS